jgi:hypothetical protein
MYPLTSELWDLKAFDEIQSYDSLYALIYYVSQVPASSMLNFLTYCIEEMDSPTLEVPIIDTAIIANFCKRKSMDGYLTTDCARYDNLTTKWLRSKFVLNCTILSITSLLNIIYFKSMQLNVLHSIMAFQVNKGYVTV